MHSAHEAIPEASDPASHDGDSLPDHEHLSAGPGPGRTWSRRTNNHSAAQTDATLEYLFHDTVPDRGRRMSADSGARSRSPSPNQSTVFESVVPDCSSAGTSTTNLQEERLRLTLESVNWKLGTAEQRSWPRTHHPGLASATIQCSFKRSMVFKHLRLCCVP